MTSDPRAPMFDAARRADTDGRLTDEDVAKIHAALDAAGVPSSRVQPDPPSAPDAPFTPAQASEEGVALIKQFEGYAKARPDGSVESYPDPGTGGAPWTIGWGSTTDEKGDPILPGIVWTRARAEQRFMQHLQEFEQAVIRILGDAVHATSQAQFDALVSFAYNAGPASLASSTLLRKHKSGDFDAAAREFGRWVYAGGNVMRGLVRRRKAEEALYRKGSQ